MHELLVIGPENWRNILERFARYKNDTGMSASVLTIERIGADFNGVDIPEKIKRAIEAHHRLHSTHYVLLAGDVDQCPVRYIKAVNTEWGTKWYPSDLYYADLYKSDGSFDNWDADQDGIIGELNFKETGSHLKFNIDRINVYPDVAVGRVPASTEGELNTYLDKVMSYEFAARESVWYNNPSSWFKRALFVVDGGDDPFGDETQSEQQAAPLIDAGIQVLRLYQDSEPWKSADPPKRAAEINKQLNLGVGFLHYMGHGNTNLYAGWYHTNDIVSLTNQGKLPIVIALSCYTGRFHNDRDNYEMLMGGDWTGTTSPTPERPEPSPVQPSKHDRDSMAEAFLVKRKTGAIAYIGAVSKVAHGGKPLGKYFSEAYKTMSKPPILGAMWKQALTRFTDHELGGGVIGMGGYYAFIHVHKMMLFGDPSLRVGGLNAPWTFPSQEKVRPELLATALGI
jgi:Peptidase family C25